MTTWFEDPPGSGLLYPDAGFGTDGVHIGSGDWRLHVERLVGDAEGAVWDLSEWAVDEADTNPDAWVWASLEWESLNQWVRGIDWVRGGEQPNGRPRIGEITVTLGATPDDAAEFAASCDPWQNYANTRPGTILRAGLTSETDARADGWIPLWTGNVESWPPSYTGVRDSGYRADLVINVTLTETLARNARIDNNALGSPVGSGDTILDRVDRLLTDAEWQYGLVSLLDPVGEPSTALQSTDMAANRLTELYLTADSSYTAGAFGGKGVVMSDVTGACLVTTGSTWRLSRLADFSSAFSGTLATIAFGHEDGSDGETWEIAYVPDSVETVNDPEGIVNDHRYTRVGGAQQTFDHPVSIGQFGRSQRVRGDLIMSVDADALALAEIDNDREARTALRVDAVDIVATGRPMALLAVAAIDWGDNVLMYPPTGADFTGVGVGVVRTLTHRVTPLHSGGVHWTATYALDFVNFLNLPGSILPEA